MLLVLDQQGPSFCGFLGFLGLDDFGPWEDSLAAFGAPSPSQSVPVHPSEVKCPVIEVIKWNLPSPPARSAGGDRDLRPAIVFILVLQGSASLGEMSSRDETQRMSYS